MAAVSCGTSHASAVSTPLRWIYFFLNALLKKLFTHVESHASAVSLLESGEYRYIKAINNNNNNEEGLTGRWGRVLSETILNLINESET